MAALIALTLFWVLPAASGIALARLMRQRATHAAQQPARSPCAEEPFAQREHPSPPCSTAADRPAGSLSAVVLPETLSNDAWSAVTLARLERLTTLTSDTGEAFAGADLIRRATYVTYLDCLRLGLGAEAQALLARAGRHVEFTNA